MTISLAEAQALRKAFERDHNPAARALAELMLHGNVILQDHGMLDGDLGTAFEQFVVQQLVFAGIGMQQFAAALAALERLSVTLDELKSLPD